MALTDPIRYGDAAGGALQGAYPNPDIQDGYIQTRHISLEAITNELIANGTITGDKLTSGTDLGEIITVPENIASGVITSAHLADIITYIRTQGNQNLSGIKSFERALQYRWPTIPADLTNKHYVDSMILSGGGSNPALEPYISGIGALAIVNQSNIYYITGYASGTKTLLNVIQINQTAASNTLSGLIIDSREIESYASGIESMRRVMVSSNPVLESYASGINNQLILVQNELTSNTNTTSGIITDLRELTEYASGIGARPAGGTSTATGSSIRQTYIQTHDFSALNAIYRTTGEQWAKAKADNIVTAESVAIIESTSGNQFTAVFEGEIENQSGLIPGIVYFLSADNLGELTPTEPITSGTISKPVMIAISDTKGIVVSYRGVLNGVSGSSTGGDTTAIEAYASGIESMRRQMVTGGDTTAVTTYASGINGQLILVQNELTSNTNTLSGVIVDLQELTEYASGIETLRRAMVTGGDTTALTTYASGIETMRRMWVGSKILYGLHADRPAANTLDSGTQWFSINVGNGQSYYVYKNPADGVQSWQGFAEQYGAVHSHEITYDHADIAYTKNYASGIETMRRAMTTGSTATGLPRGYIDGLITSNNGTDADHNIDIAAGACRDSTNAADLVLSAAITKRIDASWAVGSGNGGLDTGSVGNATWYHVWLIKRSDTGVVDALFSTSATAPTMPANYDFKRRIGAVLTNGSANIIAYTQYGDLFLWKTPVYDVNASATLGTSATLYTISVPTGVEVLAQVTTYGYKALNTISTYTSSPLVTDVAPANGNQNSLQVTEGGTGVTQGPAGNIFRTNTSAQLRMRANTKQSVACMWTYGWFDPRGKDA